MKPKTQQKMLWLIHRLTGLHAWFVEKDWIQLSSRSLRKILGWNYQKIITEAVSLGFIEVKKTYLVGRRCKSYRLANGIASEITTDRSADKTTDIASGTKVAWTECTDSILKNIIISDRARKTKDDALMIASSNLDLWLLESLLDASFPEACEPIEDVQLIVFGHPYYTICDYGRRHTPFTRLPSHIRSQVFFRSRPESRIVEIDIRNSQPVFLLVDLMVGMEKCATYSEQPSRNTKEAILKDNQGQPQPPKGAPLLCGTLLRFSQDVENGELYDRLMGELGVTDRQAFKEHFFAHILYGRVGKWMDDLPLVRAFVRLYPEAWRLICEAKSGDYRELARRMQRRESDFIFTRVLPRLMAQSPTARILTVHDAIYCEERHKHDLIAILNEEFVRLGVQANLRVTALEGQQGAWKGRSVPSKPLVKVQPSVEPVERPGLESARTHHRVLLGSFPACPV
jgi:hypothetical protein